MFTIAKGFAYKFCFCLGLGTATYYSYGTVQNWVKHEQVQVVEHTVQKHVTREQQIIDPVQPQEVSYQPVMAPEMNLAEELKSTVVEAPVAEVAATEDGEKKEEKTEEKKEEAIASTEDAVDGIPPGSAPFNYPAYPATPSNHSPSSEERTPAAANNSEVPLVGAVPTPAPSQSPTSGSVGSGSASTGSLSTGSGVNSGSGMLTAADLAALISPLKATSDDSMSEANGTVCVRSGTRLIDCGRQNHVPVHKLRWDENEGLKSDVKFIAKASSQAPVEFEIEFSLQKTVAAVLAEEKVSFTIRPTETSVHNVMKNAKNYRVIEFKFADLTVHGGEKLKQVHATFMYTVDATTGVLTVDADSSFGFSRTKVETSSQKWDLADATTLVQGELVLFADELSSSMKIEKSL